MVALCLFLALWPLAVDGMKAAEGKRSPLEPAQVASDGASRAVGRRTSVTASVEQILEKFKERLDQEAQRAPPASADSEDSLPSTQPRPGCSRSHDSPAKSAASLVDSSCSCTLGDTDTMTEGSHRFVEWRASCLPWCEDCGDQAATMMCGECGRLLCDTCWHWCSRWLCWGRFCSWCRWPETHDCPIYHREDTEPPPST